MSQDGEYEEGCRHGRENCEEYYKPLVQQLEATISLLQARLRVEGEVDVHSYSR